MHKHQAVARRQLARVGPGFVQRVAVQHHLGTKAACAFNFHARREARHHDHRTNAQALRVIRHALGMVAGAHGHHPTGPFVGAELRELVAGTALLERGGVLQVLELQEHLAAGELRKGAGFDAGRVQHLPGQPLRGGFNIVSFQHGAIVACR
ncbi:hypothetical protein D9M69_528560 [compost metagenome]